MKKFLLYGVTATLFLALSSCQSVMNAIYGTNRNLVFQSRKDITEFYVNKGKLNKDRIYYFDKNADSQSFLNKHIDDLEYMPYFALVKNDSIRFDDAVVNSGCVGVAANFITGENRVEVPLNLRGLNAYNLKGDRLNLNTGRETVVFVVTTQMGRLAGRDTRYIINQIKEQGKDIDYVYINIDRLPDVNLAVRVNQLM